MGNNNEIIKNKYRSTLKVQVRFNDVDAFGHINNISIQEFFDLGRVHYFDMAMNDEVDWNNFSAVVASNKTDFIYPAFFKDELIVYTRVKEIGNKSLILEQLLVSDDDTVKASCDSVMVGFDGATNKAGRIPQEWREAIGKIEGCKF